MFLQSLLNSFASRSKARVLLSVFLLPAMIPFCTAQAAEAEASSLEIATSEVAPAAASLAAVSSSAIDVPPVSKDSLSRQYADVTKKILLCGVDLERFSLHFRLESAKQPKFRRLRYFGTQEAGAACGLAFEITGDKQFGLGRRRPLKVNKPILHRALITATIGSTIAGSGSCLELGLNGMQAIKNKQHGYDRDSAATAVIAKLKLLDALLAQRESMVAAHPEIPGYERALAEGKIFKEMRECFVDEYARFNSDTAGYATFQNVFFALNAAYNAIGAAGAGVAYRAVKTPHLNGTANILFTISGGMASVSPFISTMAGKYAHEHADHVLERRLGEKPHFDPDAFTASCKALQDMPLTGEGSMIPSLPAAQRLALYTQSDKLFREQFESETIVMRRLEKVALQNTLLGPLIGGQLMTQGILGTVGYYRYTIQPRKQLSQYYRGAVVGTVGTSMAVLGNAAWAVSSFAYEHKLSQEKRLPSQLIEARLAHLDDIQKSVNSL